MKNGVFAVSQSNLGNNEVFIDNAAILRATYPAPVAE